MPVEGRTSPDYDDFYANDPQPRIRKMLDVVEDCAQGRLTGDVFFGMPPCGHRFAFNERHIIDEHPDGTFTVAPQPTPPSGHNSILCRSCGWHGYIDHNVWTAI
jgi:hypothetical protein